MSMIGYVLRVSEEQAQKLRANPELLDDFLTAAAEEGEYLGNSSSTVVSALNIEKSWDVLNFLFKCHSSADTKLENFLLTGESIGEDMGYGPARIHLSSATQALADFLARLDLGELVARLDLSTMKALDVYPIEDIGENERQGWVSDVKLYFPALRDYIVRAASDGNSLLVWLW